MLFFRIYIASCDKKIRVRVTDILDDYKLITHLLNFYGKVKLIYTTKPIPGIKKAAATKCVKTLQNECNGLVLDDIVNMVKTIINKCMLDYNTKNEKELAERKRVELEIKRQKEQDALWEAINGMKNGRSIESDSYESEISSDEEPDEDDLDFIANSDEESQAEEEIDRTKSDNEEGEDLYKKNDVN